MQQKFAQALAYLLSADPLIVWGLVIAVSGLIISLIALLRSSASASEPSNVNRLGAAIQDLSLRLNDFTGRWSTVYTNTGEEIKSLREKLSQLEQRLAEFEYGKPLPSELSAEEEKKKTKIGDEESNLNPLAASAQEPLYSETTRISAELAAEHGSLDVDRALFSGLEKTRKGFFSRFRELFVGNQEGTQEVFDSLEELLITSDLGVKTSQGLIDRLKTEFSSQKQLDELAVKKTLKEQVLEILKADGLEQPLFLSKDRQGELLVVLVVGVNGVGKTTTIGKLAQQAKAGGMKVLLAACDTFRAAATEQLDIWASRVGVDIEAGTNEDKPKTVAYRAIQRAKENGYDVVIVDTAGRLHTRVNLMNELKGLTEIIAREYPGAPHEVLLVVDGATGQNALQQAKEFHQLVPLSGIVVTKLDGTQKGGIVVAIKNELQIPIRYIGIGEGVGDLRPFNAKEFVEALFQEDTQKLPRTTASSAAARSGVQSVVIS